MQEQNYKFSEVLRSLLNEKKISGAELGRRIGVSKEAISKYCKGQNIPKTSQLEIAEYLDMPLAEIYGVITFYSRFTLKPKGKYNVSICLGTACFVKGSKEILENAKEKLGIDEGETTSDGKFSLDTTRCVGACGLAPVFTINEEVYGNATVKKMNEVLDEYMKKD